MMIAAKRIIASMALVVTMLFGFALMSPLQVSAAPALGDKCASSSFLGLPTWYKYLDTEVTEDDVTGGRTCNVKFGGLNEVWFVAAAVLEILLRVAALISVIMIITAGVLYILSQSSPDKTQQALKTAINALVGLVISIAAAALVSFIASRF